ncbi:MAG TPA: hypothetical protein VHT53_10190 [Candidatus Elarobacter sp.]|nr:hypothetical protein [Candidatus Elarobacter sp.]
MTAALRGLAVSWAAASLALALIGAAPAASPQPAAATQPATSTPDAIFDYAPARPACVRPRYNGVQGVTAIVLGTGRNGTNAVVIGPPAPKNAPAVLWVHWLGAVATTNHTEFLSDAEALAQRGVVSLLVDMPWSQPGWFTSGRAPESDYADTIAQVVILRRALDCLTTLPGVDPARLAYVGHDFGAMDGALLLAADPRPKYAVLMAPTLSFWEWYLLGKAPADPAEYVARMSTFDLPGWLARGKQQATLLQFGQDDEYVAQATGIAIRNAVPDRDRTLKAYRLDHALDDATAHDDRRAWLAAHLGV